MVIKVHFKIAINWPYFRHTLIKSITDSNIINDKHLYDAFCFGIFLPRTF